MFISSIPPLRSNLFLGFCKHQQECDNIVKRIAEGDTNIKLDDDFSEADLSYIKEQLMNNYGIEAELTIS